MGNEILEKRLITEAELAILWNVSPSAIQHWRSSGVGPRYKKIGGKVRYLVSDILAYEERQTFQGSGEWIGNNEASDGKQK